jgi:hypothetical protein
VGDVPRCGVNDLRVWSAGEVTDRIWPAWPRAPRAVLEGYVAYHDQHGPHRGRNLRSPDGAGSITVPVTGQATQDTTPQGPRRLIHEYEQPPDGHRPSHILAVQRG